MFSQWKPSCIGGIIISEGNKILKETTELRVLGVFLATESALWSRQFPKASHGGLDSPSMCIDESWNQDPRRYSGPVNAFQASIALTLHSFQIFLPQKHC